MFQLNNMIFYYLISVKKLPSATIESQLRFLNSNFIHTFNFRAKNIYNAFDDKFEFVMAELY
jgi:hypothetical protein